MIVQVPQLGGCTCGMHVFFAWYSCLSQGVTGRDNLWGGCPVYEMPMMWSKVGDLTALEVCMCVGGGGVKCMQGYRLPYYVPRPRSCILVCPSGLWVHYPPSLSTAGNYWTFRMRSAECCTHVAWCCLLGQLYQVGGGEYLLPLMGAKIPWAKFAK